MSSNDEGHFAAPRVDEAGPAGVQRDMVSVLTAQAHWRVLKWRLACVFQYCAGDDEQTMRYITFEDIKRLICKYIYKYNRKN